MLTVQITKDQVFTLIDQLSPMEQQEILQYLTGKLSPELDSDDTPDQVIVEGLREGLQQAVNGDLLPLSKMWEGIDLE